MDVAKKLGFEEEGGTYGLGPLMPGEKGKPSKTIGICENFADFKCAYIAQSFIKMKNCFCF